MTTPHINGHTRLRTPAVNVSTWMGDFKNATCSRGTLCCHRHGTARRLLPLKRQYIPLVNHIAQRILLNIMEKSHRQDEGTRIAM